MFWGNSLDNYSFYKEEAIKLLLAVVEWDLKIQNCRIQRVNSK